MKALRAKQGQRSKCCATFGCFARKKGARVGTTKFQLPVPRAKDNLLLEALKDWYAYKSACKATRVLLVENKKERKKVFLVC